MAILEQLVGAALMLLFLADVFLTILYARAGTGLLAPRWNRLVWTLLKATDHLAGRRGTILSFAGPVIVVALIGFWSLGLALGAALIVHPELGGAIQPSSGEASTDMVTALLVAGNSLSIVGSGDYAPHSLGTRLLFLFNSLVGASVLSLVLSYLVQVYAALRERNALALSIDLMTDGTGDASEMLARLMPGGEASNATNELGNLVRSLAAVKEAHHFYPLLFYFRFRDPLYSVSRTTFVILDLTTLIEHALDRRHYGAVTNSAAVTALSRGAMLLLKTIEHHFPTAMASGRDEERTWQLRKSFTLASERLARHGIAVRSDGAEGYSKDRGAWEPLTRAVAPAFGFDFDDINKRDVGEPSTMRPDASGCSTR